jgi:hypothetical protein
MCKTTTWIALGSLLISGTNWIRSEYITAKTTQRALGSEMEVMDIRMQQVSDALICRRTHFEESLGSAPHSKDAAKTLSEVEAVLSDLSEDWGKMVGHSTFLISDTPWEVGSMEDMRRTIGSQDEFLMDRAYRALRKMPEAGCGNTSPDAKAARV